jgi:thiamine pyrophosphate-dependent acetolactate synthase large subunit-like protein
VGVKPRSPKGRARQRAGLTHASASNTLSCQRETSRSKNPIDRNHGIYRDQDITGPEPDFATLARSCGWYAEGPIENPDDIAPALKRAIAEVKAGRPALVDTILQPR